MSYPDIFEEFIEHQGELDDSVDRINHVPARLKNYLLSNEGHGPVAERLTDLPYVRSYRRRRPSELFQPGARVNFVEVVAKEDREYICRCVVPVKGGGVCGKSLRVNYHQLYQRHIFSCGCRQRAKHPPVRLENMTIGRLEVLRWAEEEASWEAVCHECGRLLYLATAKEVRGASASCAVHQD